MSTDVMAANETPPVPVIGAPGALPQVDEVKEYEKILRISDEIFAGTHPRLKVPPQFVRKVPTRTLQTPITPSAAVEPSGAPQSKSSPLRPATSQATSAAMNSSSAAPSAGASTRVAPKPASEIDPIFLTKSDDLVRAEIQLQRQRVERVLREQVEQRKLEMRQKASAQEARPDFDVSEVLNKALEIVKPLPLSDGHGTNGTTVPSDSFDDNSFYSSRAPDSPQHGDGEPILSESERQVPSQRPEGTLRPEVPVGRRSDVLQRLEAAEAGVTDTDTQDSLYNATDRPLLPRKPSLTAAAPGARPDKYAVPREPEELLDEPEYSPPEPDVPALDNRERHEYHRRETSNFRRRAYERPAERIRMRQRSYSPASDVRIVRNHITSPAAPQPSRVSPLATAKLPSLQQPRSAQQQDYRPQRVPTDPYSGRTSPEAPVQQLMPRKRRRLQEPRDRSGATALQRRAADSVEPFIKEEPVSPPPFSDVPPARSRQPQERPVYIDISSPRYTPSIDRREAISREPIYELDRYGSDARDYEAPVEPNIARTVSRLGLRRPVRDNQDLRRVASLHHARHPDILAREYAEPAGAAYPRSTRAASYAVVERPAHHERVRYYDEAIPPYSKRYAPVDDLPPSPGFHETYVDEEPPVRIPPRRIVVDEHGNQYYETVPVSKVRTMPPPPPGRLAKVDDYNERAHVRNGSVRAPSIVDDPYGDRRYIHDMPAPQTAYRRVVDYPRDVLEERRPYPRPLADREPVLRSSSVVVGYAPGHSAYVEDREIPRDRLVRMSSVRPPASRYEEPRETIHRVQSVRPGGRDISIYVDEDLRPAREYVDRPVYTSARPVRDERYYDEEDAPRMVLDGTGEVIHRVPQRY